ncbi:hypothetical protein [Streptomyces sp. XD-27]|uniref:hypothetical protein n=1 Tax=Streptomyces sp. XD-27 TaxID=3062779 RepID=UPI0026F413B1|nr:hypothetical protein [Streptomyces sp. XD-27]WKX70897.1 hypothetical protein Q3Y56_14175 [Streptomyces sp. XD-27]
MRKYARVGILAASSLVTAVALTAPASAATPSAAGSSASAVARGTSGPTCTELSNGSLCVAIKDHSVVHLTYSKFRGGKVTVKFGFRKGNWTKWSEGFNMGVGAKVYQFKNQDLGCSPIVGILSAADGGTFETPPLTPPGC